MGRRCLRDVIEKDVNNSSYKSKLDMEAFRKKHNLDLKALNQFRPDEVEARHKLLRTHQRHVGVT